MLILLSCNHISTPFAFLLATFLLTHPLRGATNTSDETFNQLVDFYSHTPCGVQRWKKIIVYPVLAFLLTHPSRGATPLTTAGDNPGLFLLTHPSRGATHGQKLKKLETGISTHTPLTGCNYEKPFMPLLICISTHTPLTGCNGKWHNLP